MGGIDPSQPVQPIGLVLMISSPIIYAVWIVLAGRLAGERSGQRETDPALVPPHDSESTEEARDAAPTAAIMLTATAVAWWIWALAVHNPVLPAQIPTDAWLPLIGVGIVSTAIALQAFYAGARRIGAAQASLVSTVEPIYTIILASILFGETLTPIQLVGGALVIMGVLIAQSGQFVGRSIAGTRGERVVKLVSLAPYGALGVVLGDRVISAGELGPLAPATMADLLVRLALGYRPPQRRTRACGH